ncbi:hypothetical protein Hanom_Chr03g00184081 [Helianthus anomalus]
MFPNNPWDPTHPFWQNMQNNEQEDRYRRDMLTGELGYYPMPPTTHTSSHPTTQPMTPIFRVLFSTPIFSLKHTSKHTRNPRHNRNRIRSRNTSRILF